MKDILLYTKDGGYVTTVEMPQFKPMPDVIMWGERFFKFKSDYVYTECFCYAAVYTYKQQ